MLAQPGGLSRTWKRTTPVPTSSSSVHRWTMDISSAFLGPTPSTPNMRWGPPVDPYIPSARPVDEDTDFERLVRAAHNRRVRHIADLREQQRQFARRMADEEYEEAQYDVLMRDLPFEEARDDNERE